MKHATTRLTDARPPLPRVEVRLSIVLLLVAMAGIACSTPPATSTRESRRTLRIGVGGPAGQTQFRTLLTSDSLIRTMPDGRFETRLAESYDVLEAGRLLVLHLRPGVTFHDGVALTAEVVKAILERTRTESAALRPTLSDIRTIEVMGPRTLALHLERPSARLLLGDLTFGIYREVGGRRVDTGPFILESETQGEMTFVSNADYYLGRPAFDVVEWVSYTTVRAAWAAMMRHEIDYLNDVPVSAREFVEAESRFDLLTIDRPYTFLVGFNHDHPALRKQQVRQALNYAVDRRRLIERGLRGYGRVGSGVWPMHWAYGGVERTYRYDPGLADRLLTEAGYPPATESPAGAGVMASRLRLVCLVLEDADSEKIALTVQRQLYDVGVDMQLRLVSGQELQQLVASGEYEAVLVTLNIGRTLSRLHVFWHSSSRGPRVAYGYGAADEVIDELRNAWTEPAVSRAASKFQQILFEDPPAIFLAVPQTARVVSRAIELPVIGGQDILETIWQWRPAERRGVSD